MKPAQALPAVVLLIAGAAYAAEAPAALVSLRKQIEASSYRATGQLVRVEANGNRVRYAISVEGLWFDGGLHELVEIDPPKDAAATSGRDERVRILLETRSDGRDSILIYRPREPKPAVLPFDRWDESPVGAVISYEDLLDAQYFWSGQTIARSADLGARHCAVLKSTPGATDRTHYAAVETWLDRGIDYPVYAEKTMKRGGMVKEFIYEGLRRSSRVWSATQVEAKIRDRAGSALLIVKRGSAQAHLSANDFDPARIRYFEDHP